VKQTPRLVTCVRTLVAAAVMLGASPGVAAATYAAEWVAQSPNPTVEQGDTTTVSFTFKNVGDETWSRDGMPSVSLGTSNPLDRPSQFYNADDWRDPGRPTRVDQPAVAPQMNGTFTFIARAPAVTGLRREYFAPLADGVTWMAAGNAHWLDFTVLPVEPPSVTITAAPTWLAKGQSIRVAADVTDNHGVASVAFEVGGQVITQTVAVSGRSYQAELSTAALATGSHALVVRATDLGGRQTLATASFELVTDADGDRLAPPFDCNDNDPSIHPGAIDIPGDSIDQDCVGGPAPFPELTATTTFIYSFAITTRVKRIDVSRLKGGETVTIRCTGRRCAFKTKRYTGLKRGLRSFGRALLRSRRLRAGAKLTVRVTKPRTIGTYTSLEVRRDRAPRIKRACLRPGSSTPRPCP
jgi:hypothetical protein